MDHVAIMAAGYQLELAASDGAIQEEFGCDNPKYSPYDVLSFMIGPAVAISICLGFFVKRKKLWPSILHGRPGVVYGTNLLDSYRDRIAHACAIGVSCVSILDLFFGHYYVNIDYTTIPVMVRGATKTLVLIANVWFVSIAYLPLPLCLTTDQRWLGNGIGFAYTLVWTAFYAHRLVECPRRDGRIGELNFLMVIPIFVLYFGLLLQFGIGLWKCFKKRRDKKRGNSEPVTMLSAKFTSTHYYARVKYLLTPKRELDKWVQPKAADEKQLYKKLQRYFERIYPPEKGFKYSRRMVVTIVLSALTLYELGIAYIGGLGLYFESNKDIFNETGTFKEWFEFTNSTDTFYEIKAFYYILIDSFWPTCVAAMGISIAFNILFLYNYRVNTLKMWQGIKSLLPEKELRNSYIMASSLRYSGYHVGFALWGFLILQVLFWIITFVCWYFIIRPIRLGRSNFLVELIKNQWLTAVVGFVVYYAQILLARIFFLEGKGDILSLTNRRILHNTTYFFLFLNVVLGLFSCLLRIGYAVMFGILLVGRIDLCLLMKGFELWDSGFKSYVAFIQLEEAQTHPVVVSFCYLMWKMRGKRMRFNSVDISHLQKEEPLLPSDQEDGERAGKGVQVPQRKANCVARNRWHVAYTLAQNPSLVTDRCPDAFRQLLHGDTVTRNDTRQNENQLKTCDDEDNETVNSSDDVEKQLEGYENTIEDDRSEETTFVQVERPPSMESTTGKEMKGNNTDNISPSSSPQSDVVAVSLPGSDEEVYVDGDP